MFVLYSETDICSGDDRVQAWKMNNNTTDRGPTDREIFILADAAHRKRDFDSAKLYYRTIIEFERDP